MGMPPVNPTFSHRPFPVAPPQQQASAVHAGEGYQVYVGDLDPMVTNQLLL